MSKNRNRAKLKKAQNGSIYRKIWITYKFPRYYDEGWNYWKSKGVLKIKKKQILKYQVRMYRTWKYNRKTQWK